MKTTLVATIVSIAAVIPAAGAGHDGGFAAGSGVWGEDRLIAFRASNAEGALYSCDPVHQPCPMYGTIDVVRDNGGKVEGDIVCLKVIGREAFMGVLWHSPYSSPGPGTHPYGDGPNAAYAALTAEGEAVFALIAYRGDPCSSELAQQAVRAAASPLIGGVVAIKPCEVLVCPAGLPAPSGEGSSVHS